MFSCEIGEIFKNTCFYRTPLVVTSEVEKIFNFQRFLFETCGFTNNPNFIRLNWRLKRKHSPAKCVVRATEIRRMVICLYLPYSPEKFSNFRRENTCFVFSKKSSEFLLFLILLSAGIYLFKVWLKRSQNGYIFFFFYSQVAYNCSN